MRYLGALYLLYLGVKILHTNFVAIEGRAGVGDGPRGALLPPGAHLLSLTNPEAILFYVSFFIPVHRLQLCSTWISPIWCWLACWRP